MSIVNIENCHFRYNKKTKLVLNGVTTQFKDNSVNLILGINGSGKSTLIKILAGIEKIQEGKILIDGNDFKDLSIHERSEYISYVPQSINNNTDVYVINYILYGFANKIKLTEQPKEKHIIKVKEIVQKFGVSELLYKKMNQLSGGQAQIIAICRSILQNTKIILLDEPTSALDIKNQNLVLKLLKDIASENNKTIIMSSHNPNHALFLNSHVSILSKGNITVTGIAKEVITPEILRKSFGDEVCYSKDLPYDEISYGERV